MTEWLRHRETFLQNYCKFQSIWQVFTTFCHDYRRLARFEMLTTECVTKWSSLADKSLAESESCQRSHARIGKCRAQFCINSSKFVHFCNQRTDRGIRRHFCVAESTWVLINVSENDHLLPKIATFSWRGYTISREDEFIHPLLSPKWEDNTKMRGQL